MPSKNPKWDDTDPVDFEDTVALDQAPSFEDTNALDFEDTSPISKDFIKSSDLLFAPDDPSKKYSEGETIVQKGIEGAAFGFGDELSGISEAAGGFLGLKGVGGPIEDIEVDTSDALKLNKLKDLYKRGKEAHLSKMKSISEERPGLSLASEMAGGFLVPGLGAAKAGSGVIGTVKAGAKAGAVAGTGYSDADLTEGDVGGLAKDVAAGAVVGGGIGGLLHGGIEGMKWTKSAAKSLNDTIKNSSIGKRFSAAAKRTEKGEKLLFSAGKEETAKVYVDFIKDLIGTDNTKGKFSKVAKNINSGIKREVTKAVKSGKKVNIKRLLEKSKAEASDLLEHSNPKVRKQAKDFMSLLDDQLAGVEKTHLVPTKTPEQLKLERLQKIKKAHEQIQRKKAKMLMQEGDDVAKQSLARKKAELEAREIDDIPKFEEPGVYTSDEGKKVLMQKELPDQESLEIIDAINRGQVDLSPDQIAGQSSKRILTQVIDDPKLTPIELKVDPDSGLQFLTFKDASTGKIHSVNVPAESNLLSKLRPEKMRGGGKTKLDPAELKGFTDTIKKHTPIQEGAKLEQPIKNLTLDTAKKLDKRLQNVSPGIKKAQKRYSSFKDAMNKLGIDEYDDAHKVVEQMEPKLMQMMDPGLSGHIKKVLFNDFIAKMKQASPKFAKELEKNLPDIAERIDLAGVGSHLGFVGGPGGGTIRTGLEAIPIMGGVSKAKVSSSVRSISDNIKKASPDELIRIAGDFKQDVSKVSQELGRLLESLASKDGRGKTAMLYGIMQNPAYRRLLETEEESE